MLRVFRSMHEAKAEGYEMYDRSRIVFLVRRKTKNHPVGWELACVQLSLDPDPKKR